MSCSYSASSADTCSSKLGSSALLAIAITPAFMLTATAWKGPSFAPTDGRGAAHSAGTGRHSSVFRFPIGVGGEGGKRGGEVRLAAAGAGNRVAIMTDQLLEFGSAIFTNVFKDRHF